MTLQYRQVLQDHASCDGNEKRFKISPSKLEGCQYKRKIVSLHYCQTSQELNFILCNLDLLCNFSTWATTVGSTSSRKLMKQIFPKVIFWTCLFLWNKYFNSYSRNSWSVGACYSFPFCIFYSTFLSSPYAKSALIS